MSEKTIDVAVLGAGLSGLTTAALLARAGRQVRVFEGSPRVGGRAQSPTLAGAPVNLGPHALYLGGASARVLTELGVSCPKTPPSAQGATAIRGGALSPLPSNLWRLFSTPLLSVSERFSFARALGPVLMGAFNARGDESLAQWLSRSSPSTELRELLEALFRLTTYANAPEHFSAAVACRQLSLTLRKNVAYGPFERLVEGLMALPGVNVECSRPVRSVSADGRIELDDQVIRADAVVLALPLEASAKVFQSHALAEFQREAVPAKAACLDLVVSKLTAPQTRFVLGIDRPLYAAVHREQPSQVVLQLARYLAPGERGAEALPELEALADGFQPGWREVLIERRFLPELLVTSAVPLAKNGGRGFGLQLGERVFAAADWAQGGVLADSGILAAREVARLISQPALRRSA